MTDLMSFPQQGTPVARGLSSPLGMARRLSEDVDDNDDQDEVFEGGRTDDEEDQREENIGVVPNGGPPTVTDTETGEVEPSVELSVSTVDRRQSHRQSDAQSLDTTITLSATITTGHTSTVDAGKR